MNVKKKRENVTLKNFPKSRQIWNFLMTTGEKWEIGTDVEGGRRQ